MKKTEEMFVEEYLIYKKFINECKTKEYDKSLVLHKHHIIPKNLGGNDDADNMIYLSVADHIQSHLLLSYCFPVETKESIDNLRSVRLLNKKSITDKKILDSISKSYEGENNPFFGKTHTEEIRKRIAENNKRRRGLNYETIYGKNSESEKMKRSEASKNYWNKLNDEQRQKRKISISNSLKNIDMSGSKNPFAKKVQIDNIVFGSISDACKHFGVNKYYLNKNFDIKRL